MEFSDVGGHCEMPMCHMQDFLPFKCDSCSKCFCLEHRKYDSHGCNGQARKDATSLDCPICAKSIKFFRSQNPDAVWEEHFINVCSQTNISSSNNNTQQQASSQLGIARNTGTQSSTLAANKCGLPSCRTTLGLSNRFTCPKCRVDVCLPHRAPEDHSCRSIKMIANKTSSSNNNTTNTANTGAINPKSKPSSVIGIETIKQNCVSAPASRETPKNDAFLARLENQNNSNYKNSSTSKQKKSKPSTNSSYTATDRVLSTNSDPIDLTGRLENNPRDFNFDHSSLQPESSGQHLDICPICQTPFTDPVELVQHFDQAHPTSDSGTRSTPAPRKSDCSIY